MKFQPSMLATVSAVAAAALVGCEQRPSACANPSYAFANPRICRSHSGAGRGWFWGYGARASGVSDAAAGVSRGGFGSTASGHGGAGE